MESTPQYRSYVRTEGVQHVRKSLMLFAVFASTILLTQVIPTADAGGSEAREKAKQREKQIAEEIKAKKKSDLEAKKKTLDKTTSSTTAKSPKGKAATDASNTAKLKALKDAKDAVKAADLKLSQAKKDYNSNPTNSTKKIAYDDAKKALEKAKIDRDLAKLR